MMKRTFVLRIGLLSCLAMTALAGCGSASVGDAARTNLASFAVDVLTSAVNNTLKP